MLAKTCRKVVDNGGDPKSCESACHEGEVQATGMVPPRRTPVLCDEKGTSVGRGPEPSLNALTEPICDDASQQKSVG